MTGNELRALLDIATLLTLAGRRSFDRGTGYVADGRVGTISVSGDTIEAPVLGTDPYHVRVSAEHGRLVGACSCPMGDMGAFCKHCVALSLAWIEPAAGRIWSNLHADEEPYASRSGEAPDHGGVPPGDVVRAYLETLDHDELVDLIVDAADRDGALAERIRLRAEAASDDGTSTLRRALDRATFVRSYLDYAEVPAFAAEVVDVAEAIEGAIDRGHAEAVIDLAERGLVRIGAAIEDADDSDGHLGDLLRRFERIHLAACRAARPDPVTLAQRLFRQELQSEWDVFAGAAERYADVLGETGLAEYHRLGLEQWALVPPRGRGADRYRDPGADLHHEGTVTTMMESLARASADVDELIAVKSRDLSSAYRYLEVAEVCRDSGRDDEAIAWAERGLAAFPSRTDGRLLVFLADAYLEQSRGHEAAALLWAAFRERPHLQRYQPLHRVAERIGTWDELRPRAIEAVRSSGDHPELVGTTLVSIHAWEGDLDAAWVAVREFGCERGTRLQLAKLSEASHPAEALAVLKREVAEVLAMADRRNYAQAIGLLRRIERISAAVDRPDEFRDYAIEVRAANARRPAFCSMFDAAGFLA